LESHSSSKAEVRPPSDTIDDMDLSILALCHDQNMVTTFRHGKEMALYPKSREALCQEDQERFFDLFEQKLIHEVARDNFDAKTGCTAFFATTNAGLYELRRAAQDRNSSWQLSRIDWAEYSDALNSGDPSLIVQGFSGTILAFDETEALGEDRLVAEFNLLRINRIDLVMSGYDFEAVFNACAETSPYRRLVVSEDGTWMDIDNFGESHCVNGEGWGSLILMDYLKIYSAFLGLDMGRWVIAKILQQLAPGGGVVAITPFPLQFMGHGDIEKNLADYSEAVGSLNRYYQRIGFAENPANKEVMVADIESFILKQKTRRSFQ